MVSNFGRKKGQWVSPRQLIWIGGNHTSCEKINTARVHRNNNDPSTQITWQLQRHFETKNFGTIISRMRRQECRDTENPFRCVPSVLCFTGPTCLTVKYHSFGDFRELDLTPALSEHTCLQWTDANTLRRQLLSECYGMITLEFALSVCRAVRPLIGQFDPHYSVSIGLLAV
jgi:hypothetical protein